MKNALKWNKQTPKCMVYGESGRKALHTTVKLRIINFWIRIVTGDENKWVFNIHKLLRQLHVNDNYTSPGIGKVEDIFNNCSMRNIWLNPLNFNPLWIKKIFEFKAKWYIFTAMALKYYGNELLYFI